MFDSDSPFLSRVGMILSYSVVFLFVALGMVMFVQDIFIPMWHQLTSDAVNLSTQTPH